MCKKSYCRYIMCVVLASLLLSFIIPCKSFAENKNRNHCCENCCCKNTFKELSIHEAAIIGRNDIIQQLLNDGVSVDAKDRLDMTPLLYSVVFSKIETADFLLKNGADVNLDAKTGFSFYTPLYIAIRLDDYEMTNLLVSNRACLNTKYRFAETALHLAARKDNYNITKLLLEKGAFNNPGDSDGRTPLHIAALNGNIDICRLLLDSGVFINTEARWGKRPIDLAIENKHEEAVKFLKERGAVRYIDCDIDCDFKGDSRLQYWR